MLWHKLIVGRVVSRAMRQGRTTEEINKDKIYDKTNVNH